MAKDNIIGEIEPNQYFKNGKNSVLKVKDLENNLVIFDEEGKEHALPINTFIEYLGQEEYKELNTKTRKISEVLECNDVYSAVSILLSLSESTFSDSDISKARNISNKFRRDFEKGYETSNWAIKNIRSISKISDLENFILKVIGQYSPSIEDGVWQAWSDSGK